MSCDKPFTPGACAAAVRALASGKRMSASQRAFAHQQAEHGAKLLAELNHPAHATLLRNIRIGIRLGE